MVAEGETPTLPEASAKVFRPQINTDWHRLRAKALNESQGNHWDRFTSVYQPERVNQGTSPCDSPHDWTRRKSWQWIPKDS